MLFSARYSAILKECPVQNLQAGVGSAIFIVGVLVLDAKSRQPD